MLRARTLAAIIILWLVAWLVPVAAHAPHVRATVDVVGAVHTNTSDQAHLLQGAHGNPSQPGAALADDSLDDDLDSRAIEPKRFLSEVGGEALQHVQDDSIVIQPRPVWATPAPRVARLIPARNFTAPRPPPSL